MSPSRADDARGDLAADDVPGAAAGPAGAPSWPSRSATFHLCFRRSRAPRWRGHRCGVPWSLRNSK
eukprot:2408005-Lingulodinium_polyedra.AAC.1